jgi:hypothetical protein
MCTLPCSLRHARSTLSPDAILSHDAGVARSEAAIADAQQQKYKRNSIVGR